MPIISSSDFSAALRSMAGAATNRIAGTLGIAAVRNVTTRGPTEVQAVNGRFVGPNGTPKGGFVADRISQYESPRN